MRNLLDRANRFFDSHIDLRVRLIVLCASLFLLLPAYVAPLWRLEMYAVQYPQGLRLDIHSYKLEAGNNGIDLNEINTLNHYIGMKPLDRRDFLEFKWLPFLIGLFVILGLRAVVLGNASYLVDQLVMFSYFALFSLWSFGYRMYLYGHDLDPTAAVKVPPFMPPLFGHTTLANFEVYSYPGLGSYLLAAYPACLVVALFLAYRGSRNAEAAGTRS